MDNNDANLNDTNQNVEAVQGNSYQGPIIMPNNGEVKLRKEIKGYKFVIYLVILLILSVAGYLGYDFFLKKDSVIYNAEISLVSGQVEKSEKTGIWIELKNSDNVKQGDIVRVNGEGRAIITLDDGSAVRLSDNSKVTLVSLDPKNISITNNNGEVYTRVVKADRPFVVKVDDESYQAMGTAYKTVNSEIEKGVFVYESKVKVISEDIEIEAGKKFFKDNATDATLIGKIVEISDEEIISDDFAQWNKEQDLQNNEFKNKMGILAEKEVVADLPLIVEEEKIPENTQERPAPKSNPVQTVAPKITLSASTYSNGVVLTWDVVGLDVTKGYKVVKSISENPVYPGNDAMYISSGSTKSYKWQIKDGKTYNFRVCRYTGGGCDVYSNNIAVTAPFVEDGIVNSISLSGVDKNISWEVDGLSDYGFKVVYSKNSAPTYPIRTGDKYHYYSNSDKRSDVLESFDGAGTYYVRVCEYLGGKCGVYSNEIVVEL